MFNRARNHDNDAATQTENEPPVSSQAQEEEEESMNVYPDSTVPPSDSENTAKTDPSQLVAALAPFQRCLEDAYHQNDAELWYDNCREALLNAYLICKQNQWVPVRNTIQEMGRILHSYHAAGETFECLSFLRESYQALTVMVGDIIVGKVRDGVIRKWAALYEKTVSSMTAAGIPLTRDTEEKEIVTAHDAPEEEDPEQESFEETEAEEEVPCEETEDGDLEPSEETSGEEPEENVGDSQTSAAPDQTCFPEINAAEMDGKADNAPAVKHQTQPEVLSINLPPLMDDFFDTPPSAASAPEDTLILFPEQQKSPEDISFSQTDEIYEEENTHEEEEYPDPENNEELLEDEIQEEVTEDLFSLVIEEDEGQEDFFAEDDEGSAQAQESLSATEEEALESASPSEKDTPPESRSSHPLQPEEDSHQILEHIQASITREDIDHARAGALQLALSLDKKAYETAKSAVQQAKQHLEENARTIQEVEEKTIMAGEALARMQDELECREEERNHAREVIAQIDIEVGDTLTDIEELSRQISELEKKRALKNEELAKIYERKEGALAEESRISTDAEALAQKVAAALTHVDDLHDDKKRYETERKLIENEITDARTVMERHHASLLQMEAMLANALNYIRSDEDAR